MCISGQCPDWLGCLGPSDRILWAEGGHGTHAEKIASLQSRELAVVQLGSVQGGEEHRGLSLHPCKKAEVRLPH